MTGEQVAALAARVQVLEDREAIRDLIAAYGPAADRGDARRAAALWADEGEYDVGGFGVQRGRAAIAGLLEGEAHSALIAAGAAHVLSPVEISLRGDEATAWGYSCVFRWTGTEFIAHRIAANYWELRRGAAGWEVLRRVNRLLDGAEAARAVLARAR